MRIEIWRGLLLIPACLAYSVLWSQNVQTDSGASLLVCLEEYYGVDDLLANGRLYRPTNTRAARHPYFMTNEWTEGSVYVKGRIFNSLLLKYNLEMDRPILKRELKNGTSVSVVLTGILVDSFRVGRSLFVNRSLLPGSNEGSQYMEKIYSGGFSFFKKQKKIFIADFSGRTPYGKFSEPETTFYLLANGRLQEAPNRKAFLDFFGPRQTVIKKYMNREGVRLKKASNDQLSQLLEYCDKLN